MTTNKKKRSKIRFLCENRFRRCAPAGCMPLPRAPVQRPTLTSTRGRRYTRSSEDTKRISLPENALATTATTRRWRVGTSCFQDSQKQPLSSSQTTPTGASLRSTTRARPPPRPGRDFRNLHAFTRTLDGHGGCEFLRAQDAAAENGSFVSHLPAHDFT